MNPLIRLLVILGIGVGGAYFGLTRYQKLKIEDEHKLDLARIQREYLERSNWVNDVPDPEKYREERAGLMKWYFTQLTDHYNRYPAFKDYYKVAAELGAKPNTGPKKGKELAKKPESAADLALKSQYYELTKSVFDSLKDGSYNPVFTTSSNSLRFDIYKISRVNGSEGPKLRFDVVLWGAQRRMERETQATGNTISHMVTAASFNAMNFKFFCKDEKAKAKEKDKEADKVCAEMNVTGDPEIKVDYPERWIEEFPPQAVIGFYDFDPLPPDPIKMQLEVLVTSRSGSGMDIPGSFKFETPVDSNWKLAAGEAWKGATTEERSKDYIEGKAEQ
jgi:hypothetical protein